VRPHGDEICVPGVVAALALVVTVPLHLPEVRRYDSRNVAISADGRFVAFVSLARLVPADTNDRADIYVLDRASGAVSCETADAAIAAAGTPAISATGRFVVYEAPADWDPARIHILMLRDRESGVTRPLHRAGQRPNGFSRGASISADGRYVAFTSSATNLTDERDGNADADDVYVMDVTTMSCRRVGIGPPGAASVPGTSFSPALSGDGRYVAFSGTSAMDPVATGSRARFVNVYLQDLQTGATARVGVTPDGEPGNGSSYNAAISADGRYVAFASQATNLVRQRDRNHAPDVFLRDMEAKITTLVSRTPSGQAGNGPSDHPVLTADGRIVAFQSEASDLTCRRGCQSSERDINLVSDVFRSDTRTGITECISRGRTPWMEPSLAPAIDAAGAVIAFASRHPMDRDDDRYDYDLFISIREP
jgi:Tol biopolymer transport system component